MADTAEYNRLVHEKADAQNQYDDALNQRMAIQEKIDRLKEAKKALTDEYHSFSDVKRSVKSDIQQNYEWKGEKYDQFAKKGAALVSANTNYYKNLDDARDEINMEIARLEGQLLEQEGLLGRLLSLINKLGHRIENFFND